MLVTYGGFDFLVSGDLGGDAGSACGDQETALADAVCGYDIDALNVNQHGSASATSAYYCSMLQPEVALISVGPDHGYGDPKQEALDHLNDADDTYPDWEGVDHIYVTERGWGGIPGSAWKD